MRGAVEDRISPGPPREPQGLPSPMRDLWKVCPAGAGGVLATHEQRPPPTHMHSSTHECRSPTRGTRSGLFTAGAVCRAQGPRPLARDTQNPPETPFTVRRRLTSDCVTVLGSALRLQCCTVYSNLASVHVCAR